MPAPHSAMCSVTDACAPSTILVEHRAAGGRRRSAPLTQVRAGRRLDDNNLAVNYLTGFCAKIVPTSTITDQGPLSADALLTNFNAGFIDIAA